MKIKKKSVFIWGILELCAVTGLVGFAGYYYIYASTVVNIDETRLYPISYVVDGDTIRVNVDAREIVVRMLGINTPETVDPRKPVECYGSEASNETKMLLAAGRQVRLRLNPKREVTDKYGRYLAYIYRDDGLFVNEELLKGGFAREYTYGTPYSFQKKFRNVEAVAKADKIGLWGACVDQTGA